MAQPEWVPFVGLTAVVLAVFLALARVSQGAVRDDPPALPAGPDSRTDGDPQHDTTRLAERHALAEGTTRNGLTVGGPAESRERSANGEHDRATSGAVADLTPGALLANVALTQGLFGGVVLAGAFFYDIPGSALGVTPDPWNTGPGALALGVAFGVALWGANEASASVADAVGATYEEGLRELLAPDTPRGWLVLLAGVLPVVAFVEEFLFRAAVIGVPAAGFGVSPWAVAVLSSALFAVGHGAQGRVGVAVTGGLGFALAAGYILSGSLLVVVLAHYLVNTLEFLVHEWFGVDRIGAARS